MCMYCERRKDVSFGWMQPELPVSGNLYEDTHVTVHDYQTAQPEIVISNDDIISKGIATISIPANFCPACGRPLGKPKYRTFEQLKKKMPTRPDPVDISMLLKTLIETPGMSAQIQYNAAGKPLTAVFRKKEDRSLICYINTVPHTIASLKELIHVRVRGNEDDSILRKCADLTARLLMSIDQNMLFMIHRIIWDTIPDKQHLLYYPEIDIYVKADDLQNMDSDEKLRLIAMRTLIEIRRHALKSGLLKDSSYTPEMLNEEQIQAWSAEQTTNLIWKSPLLTLWT